MIISKGDIFIVDFIGGGNTQKGIRPALIIQNNVINNSKNGTVVVCPLTTNIKNLDTHPVVKISRYNNLKEKSAVLCDQIITINKSQLGEKIGSLNNEEMNLINKAILLVLDILV